MRCSVVFVTGILCLVEACSSTADSARQTFRVSVPSRPQFLVLPRDLSDARPLATTTKETHQENIRVSTNGHQGVTVQFSTEGLPDHHQNVGLSLDVVNEPRQDAWASVRSTDATQYETGDNQACVSMQSTRPGVAAVGLTLTLMGPSDKIMAEQEEATITIVGTIFQD